MKKIIYRIGDGRLWDVENAAWVESGPQGRAAAEEPDGEIVSLGSACGDSSEEYLIRTLEFYNYPLGELEMKSARGIRAMLARLDAQYLTPRILAGMATADEYALEQWRIHEEKAEPLRTRLAGLKGE